MNCFLITGYINVVIDLSVFGTAKLLCRWTIDEILCTWFNITFTNNAIFYDYTLLAMAIIQANLVSDFLSNALHLHHCMSQTNAGVLVFYGMWANFSKSTYLHDQSFLRGMVKRLILPDLLKIVSYSSIAFDKPHWC